MSPFPDFPDYPELEARLALTFFKIFAAAVENYPSRNVTLNIVDRAPIPPSTPGALNVNEVWSYKVSVANRGELDLTSVVLHIQGLNGVLLSGNRTGPWNTYFYPAQLASIRSDSSQTSPVYYFKTPNTVLPANTQLVRAHISTFDANLDHIMRDHSGHADPPGGSYSDQVYP